MAAGAATPGVADAACHTGTYTAGGNYAAGAGAKDPWQSGWGGNCGLNVNQVQGDPFCANAFWNTGGTLTDTASQTTVCASTTPGGHYSMFYAHHTNTSGTHEVAQIWKDISAGPLWAWDSWTA
jgi:hypothetical protein